MSQDQEYLNKSFLAAARSGNIEAMKAALDASADIHAKNESGQGAFELAAWSQKLPAMDFLVKAGADTAVNLPDLVKRHVKEETLRYVISAGNNMNAKDSSGKTILHRLAESTIEGSDRELKAAIELGADVNVQDNQGNTPLHIVQSPYYNQEMKLQKAKLLLAGGADMTGLKNHEGETAADTLMMYLARDEAAEIKAMLDNNTSPTVEEMELKINPPGNSGMGLATRQTPSVAKSI